jgi:hypothetical protein
LHLYLFPFTLFLMDAPTSKAALIAEITQERANLEAVLTHVSEAQMVEPAVINGWTIKDLLAHIVTWEQLLDSWLWAAITGGIPAEPVPPDDEAVNRLNAASYQANKDRLLADILADFHRSYQEVRQRVESFVTDQNLLDPLPADWSRGSPVWITIAANTYLHYQEHAAEIVIWLNTQPPPS